MKQNLKKQQTRYKKEDPVSKKQKKQKTGKSELIILLLILIVTYICYSKSLHFDFTNWDEKGYITDNNDIKNLSATNFKAIFSNNYMSNYQPVVISVYAIIYSIAGLKPYLWHLFNLLFHLVNVIMVFLFIKKLSGNSIAGLITAGLFALHPLHVESVTWIASTKDVVYTFFFVLSLLYYLDYSKSRSNVKFVLSLFAFILSCLSKGMAVTLPLILLLIDYLQFRKYNLRLILEKIPFFLVSVTIGLITIFAQTKAIGSTSSTNFIQNILIACHGILFYLVKLFIPVGLSAFYPYPVTATGYINIEFLLALPLVIILFIAVYYTKKFNRIVIFGFLFFLINILQVLQIIPVGKAIAADRYFYLSSIGPYFIIAFYIDKFSTGKRLINISTILFTAGLLILTYLTVERQNIWKNSITLWTDIINKYPDNPNNSDAYYNRGLVFENMKDLNSAIEDYKSAARLNQNDPDVFNNLGLNLYKTGKNKEALEALNHAIVLKPNNANAYNNRGNVKSRLNDLHGAIDDLTKAVSIDPTLADAYSNRGIVKGALNDFKGALEDYSRTISIEPNNPIAYNNRAGIYARTGDYKTAINDWNTAIRINPEYANALNNRGLAKYYINDRKGACEDWNEALRLGYVQAKQNIQNFCK